MQNNSANEAQPNSGKFDDGIHSVIPADVWEPMTNADPQLVGPIAIAVDRSPDRKHWAIGAAQRTAEGRIHLEIGPYEADSWSNAALVGNLIDITTEWDPIALAVDQRSPAAVIKPLLAEAEIEPVISNAPDLALACGSFLDSALAAQISRSGQRVLGDAVASASRRDLLAGDSRGIDRRAASRLWWPQPSPTGHYSRTAGR